MHTHAHYHLCIQVHFARILCAQCILNAFYALLDSLSLFVCLPNVGHGLTAVAGRLGGEGVKVHLDEPDCYVGKEQGLWDFQGQFEVLLERKTLEPKKKKRNKMNEHHWGSSSQCFTLDL